MQLYSSFPNEMIQPLPTMDSFKVSGSFGSIAITSSTRNEDPLFEEKLAGMFGQVECQLPVHSTLVVNNKPTRFFSVEDI